MPYRILADTVVIVHFGFIVFIAAGALLAWRWPGLVWLHAPALVWGAGTVIIGFPCPLTALEKGLRSLAGDRGYPGGFVDHYLKGVVYPGRYTSALRGLVAVAVLVGYVGLWRRRPFRQLDTRSAPGPCSAQASVLASSEPRQSRSRRVQRMGD